MFLKSFLFYISPYLLFPLIRTQKQHKVKLQIMQKPYVRSSNLLTTCRGRREGDSATKPISVSLQIIVMSNKNAPRAKVCREIINKWDDLILYN